ncbi:MAG: hypothetical protein Tsb0020_34570 [Haliangiales bacterium]
MSRQVTTERAIIALSDDEILSFRYVPGAIVDLDFARGLIAEAREFLGDGVPRPTTVEPGDVKGLTREARAYFAESPEMRVVSSSVALIVDSPAARIIGNVFLRVSKPELPTKLFTDGDAARAWLRTNPR